MTGEDTYRVGAVTIGQSPRTDLVSDLREILGPGIGVVERGALDGLEEDAILALSPAAGEIPLVTRLRDGREVKVSERRLRSRVQDCVTGLEREGLNLIILLCTSEFAELRSTGVILRPYRILLNTLRALDYRGRLGILVPAPEQIEARVQTWRAAGFDVVGEAASPYAATPAELEAGAVRLTRAGAELIVLDCIGFGRKVKAIFSRATGLPVLQAVTLTARVARELAGDR